VLILGFLLFRHYGGGEEMPVAYTEEITVGKWWEGLHSTIPCTTPPRGKASQKRQLIFKIVMRSLARRCGIGEVKFLKGGKKSQ